jgi:predicted nucleic acid-binding protein
MRAPYVIDASVYVARFRRSEPGYPESAAFLRQVEVEQRQIHLPIIVQPEVAGNLARGTGKPVFARRVLTILRQPNVVLHTVDEQLGNLAADLAAQHRVRGCDAVYVALAQLRNAVLITLDLEQRIRVPPTVIARTPAEELALHNE